MGDTHPRVGTPGKHMANVYPSQYITQHEAQRLCREDAQKMS